MFCDQPVKHLTLHTSTRNLADFAKTHLPELYEQGYSISRGRVVMGRYVPPELSGAGYNYILDYDDYDETSLTISPCKLQVRLAPSTTQEQRDKILKWYLALKEKYTCKE